MESISGITGLLLEGLSIGLLRSLSKGLLLCSSMRFITIGGKTATPPIGRRCLRSDSSPPESIEEVLPPMLSGVVTVVEEIAVPERTFSSRLDRSES